MTFNFDIVLLIVAIFMFITGLYFGFYSQLRKTLSNLAGLVVAIFLTKVLVNALTFMQGLFNVVNKIFNVFITVDEDLSSRVFIAILLFFLTKLIVYGFISLFKKRGIKAFIDERGALSSFMGGLLGIMNAYIIGCLLYLGFAIITDVSNANVANTIFSIVPKLNELIAVLK